MKFHAKASNQKDIVVPESPLYAGKFGRMFRNLPAWEPAGGTEDDKIAFIENLANEAFEFAGPNPELDNPDIPAGYTYLGQFIDHDITFDPTSSLQRRNDPNRLVNFRTPRFDLDCVYGRGPADQPYMYDEDRNGETTRMRIEKRRGGEPFVPGNNPPPPTDEDDLPRDVRGPQNRRKIALIGDPRNDENIIVSQLQLALLKLHNAMVDRAIDAGVPQDRVFEEAQRLTRWHYQWVVVNDFLKRVCGEEVVDTLLGEHPGRPRLEFYKYRYAPFLPIEFSGAAYRFGHSMVRGAYFLNDQLTAITQNRPIPIFGADDEQDADPDTLASLRGFRELPAVWTIQWDLYVVSNGSTPQASRLIDTKLAAPLQRLSHSAAKGRPSLAFRNLLRGWRFGLPSGQNVARRMGIRPIRDDRDDPLWLYILNEAQEQHGGRRLGTVGGRIVAEVFIGLLAGDNLSYYSQNPFWQPELPGTDGTFQLADLLRAAGVAMAASDPPFPVQLPQA